jgi:hypothetical protein
MIPNTGAGSQTCSHTDRKKITQHLPKPTRGITDCLRTNRNVFNYDLELDRDFFYQNMEPTSYRYSIIQSDNQPIPPESFYRKSKDYSTIRTDVGFDTQSLLIVQTLEQLAFQHKNISGQLMVRNNSNFDIFSTLSVDLATCGIVSYRLNAKQSLYEIELIEIK